MTKPITTKNPKWYELGSRKATLYKVGAGILAVGFMYRGVYDSLQSVVNEDVSIGALQIVSGVIVLAVIGVLANCDNK